MADNKDTEPDLEKIKAELAESARSAKKKIADSAKAYLEAMNKLAEQVKKNKDRG